MWKIFKSYYLVGIVVYSCFSENYVEGCLEVKTEEEILEKINDEFDAILDKLNERIKEIDSYQVVDTEGDEESNERLFERKGRNDNSENNRELKRELKKLATSFKKNINEIRKELYRREKS